jgi:DoxX-like family
MTTLFSTAMTANQTPALPRGRVALVALWLTQIALAGMFLFSGGLKLTGAPELVALFDAIGIGQWFRYVTGSIEVVSAVALLAPSWAALGAPAHSHDGRRRVHPSVHRRRVSSARDRVAHWSPRDRVGTS